MNSLKNNLIAFGFAIVWGIFIYNMLRGFIEAKESRKPPAVIAGALLLLSGVFGLFAIKPSASPVLIWGVLTAVVTGIAVLGAGMKPTLSENPVPPEITSNGVELRRAKVPYLFAAHEMAGYSVGTVAGFALEYYFVSASGRTGRLGHFPQHIKITLPFKTKLKMAMRTEGYMIGAFGILSLPELPVSQIEGRAVVFASPAEDAQRLVNETINLLDALADYRIFLLIKPYRPY